MVYIGWYGSRTYLCICVMITVIYDGYYGYIYTHITYIYIYTHTLTHLPIHNIVCISSYGVYDRSCGSCGFPEACGGEVSDTNH